MKKLVENYLGNLSEAKNDSDILTKIIEFFQKNPNHDDHKVHAFAEEEGMEPDDLEEKIYELVTKMVNLKGGDIPDEKFDSKELAMGIEIEQEHIDIPIIAKAITKAHLSEIPDYNTRLKEMEKQVGVKD